MRLFLILTLAVATVACQKAGPDSEKVKEKITEYSPKELTSFSLSTPDGKISETALGPCETVFNVCVPRGTDLTGLVATFTFEGESVTVDGVRQESGKTVNSFEKSVIYTVVASDKSSKNYKIRVHAFDLPALYLALPSGRTITSKEDWMTDAELILHNVDGSVEVLGPSSVKGRGNTSWEFPKKSYTLKLDEKKKIFGIPKDSRWNLISNYMDRTSMRNAVTLELARKAASLEWTPAGDYVELILNGEHKGNYYLCEKIKSSKNRINISSEGFILELDSNYDEEFKFKTAKYKMPVNVKEPDGIDMNQTKLAAIKEYMDAVELAVSFIPSDVEKYREYIDIDSFIDYWFIQEMSGNTELSWPKSLYMYKEAGGLLKAGPCWDFDWGTYGDSHTDVFNSRNYVWYGKMFQDPAFVARVKKKWKESVDDFKSVLPYIDEVAEKLKYSDTTDSRMWPINSRTTNGDETLSFDEAVARLKRNLERKINWMDVEIEKL